MARRLSESTKLIRQLQVQYTNKEIAKMLGYKSPNIIVKVSNGNGNLSKQSIQKANSILNTSGRLNKIPTPTQVKRKQQTLLRNSSWRQVSINSFLASIDVSDYERLVEVLESFDIVFAYYHHDLGEYLLSINYLEPSTITTSNVTNLLFEFVFMDIDDTNDEDVIVQYPFYPWKSIVPIDAMQNFETLQAGINTFLLGVYREKQKRERLDEENRYAFISTKDYINFLAYADLS